MRQFISSLLVSQSIIIIPSLIIRPSCLSYYQVIVPIRQVIVPAPRPSRLSLGRHRSFSTLHVAVTLSSRITPVYVIYTHILCRRLVRLINPRQKKKVYACRSLILSYSDGGGGKGGGGITNKHLSGGKLKNEGRPSSREVFLYHGPKKMYAISRIFKQPFSRKRSEN